MWITSAGVGKTLLVNRRGCEADDDFGKIGEHFFLWVLLFFLRVLLPIQDMTSANAGRAPAHTDDRKLGSHDVGKRRETSCYADGGAGALK